MNVQTVEKKMSECPSDRDLDKGGPPDDDLLAAGLLETADISEPGSVQVSSTEHAHREDERRLRALEEWERAHAENGVSPRALNVENARLHERLGLLEERAEDLQESLNIVCRHAEQACLAYESRSMPATLGRFRDVEDRIAALRNVIAKASEPCPPGGWRTAGSMEALTVCRQIAAIEPQALATGLETQWWKAARAAVNAPKEADDE